MSIANQLRRLHRRLLPDNPDLSYTPYLWLMYLLFLLPGLFFARWDALTVWLTALSVVVFLPLYFRSFWLSGKATIYNSLLIALMGALLLPINISANTYFIYAAAAVGFIANLRYAVMIISGLAAALILESWFLGLPLLAIVIPSLFVLMVGCANIFQGTISRKNNSLRLSQAEVSRLATVAERERISRDLHDLLGHSLSLITLKAELAGKLLKREDIARASQEVGDLERISRTALSEVREAVSGYRQAGLSDELQHATQALQSANINLKLAGSSNDLPDAHDNALAMCVREAVTNVIRHSGAQNCWIRLSRNSGQVSLSIRDDGESSGENIVMGSGLKGMRDRLSIMGGALNIDQSSGLHLEIQLPSLTTADRANTEKLDINDGDIEPVIN